MSVSTVLSIIAVTHRNIVTHQTEFKHLETTQKQEKRDSFFAKMNMLSSRSVLPPSAVASPEDGPEDRPGVLTGTGPVQVEMSWEKMSWDSGTGTGVGSAVPSSDASVTELLAALVQAQERTNQLLLTQIQHSGQFDMDDKPEDNSWKVDLMQLVRHVIACLVIGAGVLCIAIFFFLQLSKKSSLHRM